MLFAKSPRYLEAFRLRTETGSVLVEAAVVVPFVLAVLIFFGGVASLLQTHVLLTDAIRTAGRAGVANNLDCDQKEERARAVLEEKLSEYGLSETVGDSIVTSFVDQPPGSEKSNKRLEVTMEASLGGGLRHSYSSISNLEADDSCD